MKRFQLYGFVFFSVVCAFTTTQAATWLIKADGTGDVATIQDGVDASSFGDTVLLAAGTYTGVGNHDVDYKGKAITVTSQSGAAATIIDCQGLGRGFVFTSGETNNSTLSHVTIRNGSADRGGAIFASIAKPTIVDNIITNNTALDAGGGIFVFGAVATPSQIARNTITGNTVVGGVSSRRGGGIWSNSITLTIADNTISDNSADEGGGVWISGSADNTLCDNVIIENTATTSGGGVYVSGFSPGIDRNTVAGNEAGNWGGGIYVSSSGALFEDCVVADNSSGLLGAGIYVNGGTPTLRNGTLAGNTGTGAIIVNSASLTIERTIIAFNNADAMLCFRGGSATVSCSDLYGNLSDTFCGVNGGQNFSSDPLFCNAPAGDYSIASSSPATPTNSPCSQLVGALPPCLPSAIEDDIPVTHATLFQNFPNPFNPTTTIRYRIQGSGSAVTLGVYDVGGRLIRTLVNEHQTPGIKSVTWDGRADNGAKVSSGVYFYQITTPGLREARKMILLK